MKELFRNIFLIDGKLAVTNPFQATNLLTTRP
jgi:hypothetical protein